MNDHRALHSPEYQTGMNIHRARPACFDDTKQPLTERGQVTVGWPGGVKPGMRNPFHDNGRACGQALTQRVWEHNLEHTPLCRGCARGRDDEGNLPK